MSTNEEMMNEKKDDEESMQAKFERMTLRECDTELSNKEESVKAKEEERKGPSIASSHLVFTDGDHIYDVKLTQSNLQNTNNKFYEISLLESDNKKYKVIFRWGRSDTHGMSQVYDCCSNLEKAKILFSRKFLDKTGNVWPSSFAHFKKVDGMYTMIDKKRQIDEVNVERIVDDTKKEVNLFLREQLPMEKDVTEPSGPAFATGLPSIF